MPPPTPPPRPAPRPPARPSQSALRARDPDTPLEQLVGLLEHHPDDFLLNPVLPLLPVLHGDFFRQLPYTALIRLAGRPRLPDFVLRSLVGVSSYELGLLFLHPRLPPDLLRSLCKGATRSQLTALAEGPVGQPLVTALLIDPEQPPEEFLPRLLSSMAADPDLKRRAYAAAHPLTPPEHLDELACHPHRQLRQNVATNPGAPAELRARLAQGDDGPAQAAMTREPTVAPEHLTLLASSRRAYVRAMTAEHPSSPSEALDALAHDPSWLVRRAVAWNPCTSPDLLERLAADPRPEVRAEVSWQRSLRGAA